MALFSFQMIGHLMWTRLLTLMFGKQPLKHLWCVTVVEEFVAALRGSYPNPFQEGDIIPGRVPLYIPGQTLPFPTPFNVRTPLKILDTYWHGADKETGSARHNRVIKLPGFGAVLVTRDPKVIRAILTQTGEKDGEFDRDTAPSEGIAASTQKEEDLDSLLFGNGMHWRESRKIASGPFGKMVIFQDSVFEDFATSFIETAMDRLGALKVHFRENETTKITLRLEPEIKAVMLQMLANNFLGAKIPVEDIRNKYVPTLEKEIDDLVRFTVWHRIPILKWFAPKIGNNNPVYEELTNLVLEGRKEGRGTWKNFKYTQDEIPDEKLKSNLRVILAGALEATSSLAGWGATHLAQHPQWQERISHEIKDIKDFTPGNLAKCKFLNSFIEETLRFTPSLYFLPRKASKTDLVVKTSDGRTMVVPEGTHVLLDVWHANRHEDFWGVEATGYPANEFHPERWEVLAQRGANPKDFLHFGFGYGPRTCPGVSLARLEASLALAGLIKMFKFRTVNSRPQARAGVSTKPKDGTLVELELRNLDPELEKIAARKAAAQKRVGPEVGSDNRLHIVVNGGDTLPKKIAGVAMTMAAGPWWLTKMSDVVETVAKDHRDIPVPQKMLDAIAAEVQTRGLPTDQFPKEGKPLLVVANHPRFGLGDGLALAATLMKQRTDVKLAMNDVMVDLPGFSDFAIGVNKDGSPAERRETVGEIGKALSQGCAVIVLSAGEPSRYNPVSKQYEDSPWSPSVSLLARRYHAPVMPVGVQDYSPGFWFRLTDWLSKKPVKSVYPMEILRQRGQTVQLSVGDLVGPEKLKEFGNDGKATQYLRALTYGLTEVIGVT
jgi:putative hemolysin